ncbi:MAG: AmmeMemoRadiSam system protein B [Elusimicrobiota bacterium]
MKKNLLTLLLLFTIVSPSYNQTDFMFDDTWANWTLRLTRAYQGIPQRKVPGRTMGIIVPADTREDLIPLSAFGYEAFSVSPAPIVIILMDAPDGYTFDGLAIPGVDVIETSIGRFSISESVRTILLGGNIPVTIDPNLFQADIPRTLLLQLAQLKHVLRKIPTTMRILPVYVRFSDANSQVKDIAPYIAEKLKDVGIENDVQFIIATNLSRSTSPEKLIQADAPLLNAIRNLDVDAFLQSRVSSDTGIPSDALLLGMLTVRTLGADHSEIFAYAHSGQLVLTKDKSAPLSYFSAGFASAPVIKPRLTHVDREQMIEIFNELLRADILSITRQTCASALDATAAKPSSLSGHKPAKQKWPVYVSLYDSSGNLAGQAGSHVAIGALEESIRNFAVEAVRQAQPTLTKTNFGSYIVEVAIPYGFLKVSYPEELISHLNGAIVYNKLKTAASHPDVWRTVPDSHLILGALCYKLGLKPWSYSFSNAKIESFRLLAFNEKEPFQDLGALSRKSKKKKTPKDDESLDSGGGGAIGGSTSPFGF